MINKFIVSCALASASLSSPSLAGTVKLSLEYVYPTLYLQIMLILVDLIVAATVSADVQSEIVNTTHTFLTNGLNSIPFGTKYSVEGDQVGVWIGNKARSTVGLSFGLLAVHQGYWGSS